MKNKILCIHILIMVFNFFPSITNLVSGQDNSNTNNSMNVPNTFRDDIVDDFFGTKVADPYRWLEDENSDNTQQWVQSQIDYTNKYLNNILYKEKIRERLTKLFDYEKYGTPFLNKGKSYIFKNNGLQNQNVLYTLDSKGNEKDVLIDPNKFSEDGTKALSSLSFSFDGKYLAYMVSESGTDWNTCYILNLKTKKLEPDTIKWIKFSGVSWYKDGFFYSRYPNEQSGKVSTENKNHKLYFHKLGTSQESDIIWFQDDNNPNRNIGGYATEDGSYLILTQTESTSGNSFSFIDLKSKSKNPTTIVDKFDDDFSFIENKKTVFYVLTNNKAPNQKIIAIDTKNPDQKNWKTVIAETKDPIQSVEIIDDKFFVTYLHNAYSQVKIYDLEGRYQKDLKLPGIGSISGFSGEKKSKFYYFSYSSFLFPTTIYKMNVKDLAFTKFKSSNVDFDCDKYITEQKWFKSKDGTKVPMFITHKKNLKLDGNNPTLLYGYGGFNISITPSFSASRLFLLENGGIFVVANIRGGGEFGEKWHKGGTLENKQNVFDDFIAAAEYLISNKYTTSEKLAIEGGSNGGLLIGACMTQRPELYKVAFPRVGVLDMLRYHKFTIGWAWATDYGKSDEEKAFNYLYKYSPVHNVKKTSYPATMIMTADHDDRVVPSHSFKFGSELQYNNNGSNPILIRIDRKAGHGSGKPITKVIDELTDFYSFMFYNFDLKY